MIFRKGFFAGLIVAIIWAIWLIRLWQPQRQVELHSAHLLEQIENKNWTSVADRVSPAYQDRWGHDRAILLERLREAFRLLSNPRIVPTQPAVRCEEGHGYWTAKITLTASGEFADYVQSRVNSIETPFELEWQAGATWPWDWKLVSIRNPDLEIRDYSP
ncbi:MAG: hypothetical protein ACJ8M4_02025 [Chthoniobacterales bacterium]